MTGIHLIGTMHSDIERGPKNLFDLYDRLQPDEILTESSDLKLDVIFESSGLLEKALLESVSDRQKVYDFLIAYMDTNGWEYLVNLEYAQEKDIPHFLVDVDGVEPAQIMSGIPTIVEYIKKYGVDYVDEVMPSFFQTRMSEAAQKEYCRSIRAIEGTDDFERFIDENLNITMPDRVGGSDKYMERCVRAVYNPEKTIAYPVGMAHVLHSKSNRTLYSKIKDDLKVTRHFLD